MARERLLLKAAKVFVDNAYTRSIGIRKHLHPSPHCCLDRFLEILRGSLRGSYNCEENRASSITVDGFANERSTQSALRVQLVVELKAL